MIANWQAHAELVQRQCDARLGRTIPRPETYFRVTTVTEQESREIINRLNERGVSPHLDVPPVGFERGRFQVALPPTAQPGRVDVPPALGGIEWQETPEPQIFPGWHNQDPPDDWIPVLLEPGSIEFNTPWAMPDHDIMTDMREAARMLYSGRISALSVDVEFDVAHEQYQQAIDTFRAVGWQDSMLSSYISADEARTREYQPPTDWFAAGRVPGFLGACDENGNLIKVEPTPESEKEQARLLRHNLLVDDPHPEDREWWEKLYLTAPFTGKVEQRWHSVTCACDECLDADLCIDGYSNTRPQFRQYTPLCRYDHESSAAPLMFRDIPEEYGRRP